MQKLTENDLSATLVEDAVLREVEPNIYSVFPDNESGSEYDTQFGFLYDLIACNPLYNRLIWGYSVKMFAQLADQALRSSQTGYILDLGCGSLAFTAKVYGQHTGRPVVLMDQSIKMLRMAKATLTKRSGNVPENMTFLHANALQLPFKENVFTTILSENLLHCLDDTGFLLKRLKNILATNGNMYFTTLVRAGRFADKYYEALANSGKLISRNITDHQNIFNQVGLSAEYRTTGNILVIQGSK